MSTKTSETKTLADTIRDLLVNILASIIIFAVGWLIKIAPLDIMIAITATFFVTTSFFLIFMRRYKKTNSLDKLGIIGFWRDELHFMEEKKVSFAEYCKQLIHEVPSGGKVQIVGYDWIEIFPDTIVLERDIFGENGTSRIKFDVVLMDPASVMPTEKRAWEMTWRTSLGETVYQEGVSINSLNRLKTKIESTVTVAKIFESERPQYFRLKLTPVFLNFSFIMTSERVIGIVYGLPWKGKDSLIFEARKSTDLSSQTIRLYKYYGKDFYGFLKGEFDALWDNPSWRQIETKFKSND